MRIFASLHWRRGIPLHVCISAIVVGTVVLMALLNLIQIHNESAHLGRQYASDSFRNIAKSAEREIASRIDPILALANTAAALPPPRGDDFIWEKAKESHFRHSVQALNSHGNILAVNYGYADGSFFSVTSLEDDKVRKNYKAPPTAIYALWAVALDNSGKSKEWWSFLDANYLEVGSKITDPVYDPRARAWYKEASQKDAFTMTPPYIFNTSKELGMAAALPLQDKSGVFSINITLRNFDSLLDSVPLSPSGYLFILDEKRRIIGERSPHQTASNENSHPKNDENLRQLLPFELYPTPGINGISRHLRQCNRVEEALLINIENVDFFLSCKRIAMGNQDIELIMLSPLNDFTTVVEKFFSRTLLFGLVTMLVFIPVAVWLAYRVGAALKALLHETLLVKKLNWAKTQQIPSRIQEIRRLGHAIATMRKSIQKRTEALKNIQSTLEETVRQRTAELSRALVLAEEATEAKSKFLSTVSHEIRTPMNAIVGFTYLFHRANLTEKQIDYLEKIRISSETLLRIINDVLDFSKIEAGRLEIENIPFHLDTVLDTVASITKFPAKEKRLEFIVEHDPTVPSTLIGDPTRLHQILLNLMSNAIKFTDSGSVELRVCNAPVQPKSTNNGSPDVAVLFRVTDTGIGMTEEQMERLFQPFAQADNSISRKYGGTGLGLAICKQLAELMGGKIQVRSRIGEGTVFEVTVTLASLPEADLPVGETTMESRAVWKHNALVLVVDDNAINREIAGALLESTQLRVDFAENGLEALEKIRTTRYELVFMDMQMPVMDGLEATRKIRELATSTTVSATDPLQVPIIAMTANAMIEDRHRCLQAGMNDHIAKPIVPTALMGLLGLWLPPE